MYVQKCLHVEYYYKLYNIYGDTDESTTILAHSTNTWPLCNAAPSFKDNPLAKSDNEFDEWLLKVNRRMAYKGMVDECKEYHVFETCLEQAQEPLKPSIRPPADEDWECMRKTLVLFQPRSFTIPTSILHNMEYCHLPLIYRKDSSLPIRVSTCIKGMKLMQQIRSFLIHLPWMVVRQALISLLDMIQR